ncbi:hypothetical protein CkaCkLH20_06604 [Colletotrichum karsti]|uniref:Major facilitator superfamily (MFS) profile domain-containing protein n=1 Tax=Colletotrichum karsti TaxID=1095194 RepID=A0A9P6LKJ7_9PEZI|nr:uncharacterized protein CkaCkLH20_06604 [Colletotrichum karsti]KAF9875672.1 hypothetical protein CkaCkLH20_06604 [Colletotrichum karsti]
MWLQHAQGKALAASITFACGIGFASFGFGQGVFGAFLGNESFIKTFNNPNPTLQGHITATYDLGCFFGAIFTMIWGGKLGSRKTILLGCTVLIIGAVLQAASYHVAQMIIGRLVGGVGNGMNTAAIPVWQSETAAAHQRGRIMVLQLALNQVGNVTANWLNYGMTFIASNSVSWRFPIAFQCFFAFLTMVLIPWLPDSPRWLAMQDRTEEALQVIRRLGGTNRTEEQNLELLNRIRENVAHEMSVGKVNFKSFFKRDSLHTTRRVLLGAGTQFMQQWSGVNAIVYYLPVVFASLGLSRNLPLFIENFGRKQLMFWGAIAQSFCFCLVTIGLGIGGKQWESVAVAFIFGYFTAFGSSWIAIPWMYPAEINTQRMRIAGAGISTATNWINNYVVVLITPVGISNLGWKFYLMFAVFNAAFVPVVQLFYVETARMSLEQIDQIFEKKTVGSDGSLGREGSERVASQEDEEKEPRASHVSVRENPEP